MAPYYTVHEFSDDCKSKCITGKLSSLVKAYIIAQECGTRKVVRFLDDKAKSGDTVWSNKRGIFYKNVNSDESKILESLTLDAANEIQSHLFQLGVHRKMKHEHHERLDRKYFRPRYLDFPSQ